jgi:hypothetical protein
MEPKTVVLLMGCIIVLFGLGFMVLQAFAPNRFQRVGQAPPGQVQDPPRRKLEWQGVSLTTTWPGLVLVIVGAVLILAAAGVQGLQDITGDKSPKADRSAKGDKGETGLTGVKK